MREDKEMYIRRCRACGKELPIGTVYNFCERLLGLRQFVSGCKRLSVLSR